MIDMDTGASSMSWDAARWPPARPRRHRSLRAGEAEAAFVAVAATGHHATPSGPMGFCLLNNVAVAAAGAGRRGRAGADRRLRRPPRQRHPGRLLRRRPTSLYVSFHEWPLYPGTGPLDEIGHGDGPGHHQHAPSGRRHRRRLPGGHRRGGGPAAPSAGARPGCWCRPASTPIGATRSPAWGSRRRLRRHHRPARAARAAPDGGSGPRGRLRPRGVVDWRRARVAALAGERVRPEGSPWWPGPASGRTGPGRAAGTRSVSKKGPAAVGVTFPPWTLGSTRAWHAR